jgi:hypothetical protein
MKEVPNDAEKSQWLRRLLVGLACVVALIALAYAEEDLRGILAWHSYKRQLEAKGEKLDFSDFVPPKVPDDQNFAMTPIVSTSYGNLMTSDGKIIPPRDRDKNYENRMSMNLLNAVNSVPTPTGGVGDWQTAKMSDLSPWQSYYRALAAKTNDFPVSTSPQSPAADVLLALSKYDSDIEELREAAKLPESRFPLDYGIDDPAEILLPHLGAIKQASQVLQMRALAELQNNQSDKAFEDVKLIFRLVDSVRTEPFIITHLVRAAVVQIALQPVYEGLANHQWSDAQLAELDSELAGLDFLADFNFSVGGEGAAQVKIVSFLEHNPSRLQGFMSDAGNGGQGGSFTPLYFAPAGWFYQNDVALAQLNQAWKGVVDDGQQTVSPKAVRTASNKVTRMLHHHGPYNMLTAMLAPQLGGYAERAAFAQNAVNMARIAIALERFRLANGEFPGSLDVLTPKFMQEVPHDVINGDPLHYRLTQDGQFILYSVGWNEADDGGKVVTRKNGVVDRSSGDWVWRYPQK